MTSLPFVFFLFYAGWLLFFQEKREITLCIPLMCLQKINNWLHGLWWTMMTTPQDAPQTNVEKQELKQNSYINLFSISLWRQCAALLSVSLYFLIKTLLKILFKATGRLALPPVALLRLAVIVLLLITLQMTEVRMTFSLHAEKLGMHGLCGNEFALSFHFPLCSSQSRFPNTIKIPASRRCDKRI